MMFMEPWRVDMFMEPWRADDGPLCLDDFDDGDGACLMWWSHIPYGGAHGPVDYLMMPMVELLW